MQSNDRLAHVTNHLSRKKIKTPVFARPNDRASYIYFITCNEFVKVGIADNPQARLCQLQVGSPYPLRMISHKKSSNAATHEWMIHCEWRQYEVRGEWFKVPIDELIKMVAIESLDDFFKIEIPSQK